MSCGRAIRLALEVLEDPDRASGCFRRIGQELDISPDSLRGWVRQTQVDTGQRPGTKNSDAQRLAALEAENWTAWCFSDSGRKCCPV